MDELEQWDEGLGLDTITRAKKREISKLMVCPMLVLAGCNGSGPGNHSLGDMTFP